MFCFFLLCLFGRPTWFSFLLFLFVFLLFFCCSVGLALVVLLLFLRWPSRFPLLSISLIAFCCRPVSLTFVLSNVFSARSSIIQQVGTLATCIACQILLNALLMVVISSSMMMPLRPPIPILLGHICPTTTHCCHLFILQQLIDSAQTHYTLT